METDACCEYGGEFAVSVELYECEAGRSDSEESDEEGVELEESGEVEAADEGDDIEYVAE